MQSLFLKLQLVMTFVVEALTALALCASLTQPISLTCAMVLENISRATTQTVQSLILKCFSQDGHDQRAITDT